MVSSNTSARTFSAPTQAILRKVGTVFRPRVAEALIKPFRWDSATVTLQALLDRTYKKLTSGVVDEAVETMNELLNGLSTIRNSGDTAAWNEAIQRCLNHPVRSLIHQDPFASRCYEKPRGYAGDALLIDFLYTRDCRTGNTSPASELGAKIFEYTRDIDAGRAVRCRRDLMAVVIDEVTASRPHPHILSVACGHLREAKLSKAVTSGNVERFVALDQDEQSLAIVDKEVSQYGVNTVHDSIKALFRGSFAGDKFDLIYSTGLYDYLDDRLATKLTQRMFDMLKPGGRLVVANFVPGLVCSAYMEAFLDWKLIYRNADQLHGVSTTIPETEIGMRKVYLEDNGTIVFLDITKKSDGV